MLTGAAGNLGAAANIRARRIEKIHAERFKNQEFDDLQGLERPKDEAELRVLDDINRITNEKSRSYGGTGLDIPPRNVHVIRSEHWNIMAREKGAGLFPETQAIIIGECALVPFARKIMHEMIHAKMSNRIYIPPDDAKSVLLRSGVQGPYRVNIRTSRGPSRTGTPIYVNGLEMIGADGRKALTGLNEGLLEHLAEEQFRDIAGNPDIARDLARSKEIIRRNSKETLRGRPLGSVPTIYYVEIIPDKNGTLLTDENGKKVRGILHMHQNVYRAGNRALRMLADKIRARNADRFNARKDVIDLFARAAHVDRPDYVRALVDHSFGRGTFERMAEADRSDGKELERFVNAL